MNSFRRWTCAFDALLIVAALLAPLAAYAAEEAVNYDDPNMVVTNEFAGDAVSSCSHELAPAELTRCLREKGLSAPQGVALGQTTQRDPKTR